VVFWGSRRNTSFTYPANLFEHGIVFPHFAEAFSRPDLYWAFLLTIITLVLIDGTESLATIQAIDKIDPFKRKSDPNVTLRAMGVSNTASSLLGGLTIIPGGMKSTTNMLVGGRTLWANFYYACFQLIFLLFATTLINQIPKAAWQGCSYGSDGNCARTKSSSGSSRWARNRCLSPWSMSCDVMDLGPVGRHDRGHGDEDCLAREGCRTSVPRWVGAALKELFGNPVIRIGDGRGLVM